MKIESRYINGDYLAENPEWDKKDAAWKASKVISILSENKISPTSICEIGCGSGDILKELKKTLTSVSMTGFDISPQLTQFWDQHNKDGNANIDYYLKDFHETNKLKYDVLLMLDVFEHVRDPFSFLENSVHHANYFVFHIPLDLSASSIIRGKHLLHVRRKVGHLHFYSKDLAIETLTDTGYAIIDWKYTGAYYNTPHRNIKTRLLELPHKILSLIHKEFAIRLLGGETLLVLAKKNQVDI